MRDLSPQKMQKEKKKIIAIRNLSLNSEVDYKLKDDAKPWIQASSIPKFGKRFDPTLCVVRVDLVKYMSKIP